MAVVQLLALVFTTLALVPAMAHVLELPNKLPMSREEYLTVQRLYRGWNRAGYIVIAALVTTLLLALFADDRGRGPALLAFCAILGTQIVFWQYTFPVNRITQNWTLAPENWRRLRDRWEISHAVSAVLNFLAVVSVAAALLVE